LGVKINGWYKLLTSPPQYIVDIDGHQVTVGDGGAVLRQASFNRVVYETCDIAIKSLKKDQWEKVTTKLGTIKEVIYPDSLETGQGFMRYWLQRYLLDVNIVDTPEDIESSDLPCRLNTGLYFSLAGFKRYLLQNNQKGVTGFSHLLREIGCELGTRGFKRSNGTWSTKSLWSIPGDLQD